MRRCVMGVASLLSAGLFVIACSSGDAGEGTAPPGSSGSTTNPTPDQNPAPTPEPPLKPRPACSTVATGPSFGDGCSGTGSGKVLCALTDSKCGTDSCVYDSRNAGTFSFYCSSKCTVGDDTARCPSGYECVAPSATCSGGTDGVCAQRTGFGCDSKVVIGDGTFFEGPAGELYHLARQLNPDRTTLSLRQGNTFKAVQSWDGDGTVRAIVRNADSVLLVTSTNDVLVKDGKATATKKTSSTPLSYDAAYGVGKDGAFVLLNTTGGGDSFAALSRRGDDGSWNEVGPTRQRVTKITALRTGFLAVCQKTLCASADGETFAPVAGLPPGVTLETPNASGSGATPAHFAAVGASIDDFHFTTGGKLYHQRKGTWVEEGPHAAAPPSTTPGNSGYVHNDILRAFSDGTPVFHTWVAGDSGSGSGGYATYVYGDDCWSYSPGGNLDNTDLIKGANGNVFVYADSFDKELCSIAAR